MIVLNLKKSINPRKKNLNPVITFPSLASGAYKLEIQSMDGEGKWSERILQLDIQVRPYFYKSWWFLLLLLM